jgi:hypothetical protein
MAGTDASNEEKPTRRPADTRRTVVQRCMALALLRRTVLHPVHHLAVADGHDLSGRPQLEALSGSALRPSTVAGRTHTINQ